MNFLANGAVASLKYIAVGEDFGGGLRSRWGGLGRQYELLTQPPERDPSSRHDADLGGPDGLPLRVVDELEEPVTGGLDLDRQPPHLRVVREILARPRFKSGERNTTQVQPEPRLRHEKLAFD